MNGETWRHESPGTVYIADCLSQSLTHICAWVKRELYQTDVLDRFRFHGLNPRNVEEVIFVVVDKIAFHLRGGHAPERLRHINNGQV